MNEKREYIMIEILIRKQKNLLKKYEKRRFHTILKPSFFIFSADFAFELAPVYQD